MALTPRWLGIVSLAWILTVFAFPLAAQDDLPEGKGKVILENTCTECHGLDKVLTRLRTTKEWRETAVRMRSKGATMSDDEFKTLVEYLAQNFGAVEKDETQSTKAARTINVNTASAKEIEIGLELRPAVAAAIVRYREARGGFREWRDLAKVKGIDQSRLTAVKDRITF
jgi:competence ComEA-like helix-hairpin-helix protein